uniref:Uncharacterized protein n=1 Tax=Eutreptiella gymnastica TaxID=73025 RepID=A0A7S1JGK4_9EUGL|mmetsp:Transcript_94228/g.162948  ORF Transcript_94228/g.162948 Transcript_94228/m.162948 type:complete len:489 (+) Transcript_94228:67-1533(+)
MPPRSTHDVLAQWDKGNRAKRISILTALINAHRNCSGPDIERDLGPATLLLFTRITAWLRLTYQLGYELSVQLSAIALFLQGQRFLSNFLEVGGIPTIIDLQSMPNLKGPDKQNALLLLIHIANSGRVYREMICDGAGTDLLVQGMLNEERPQVLELYGSLFMALGQANPRKSSLVHAALVYIMLEAGEAACLTAATTLRSLQMTKQYHTVNRDLGVTFPSITATHANRKVTTAGGSEPRVNVTMPPSARGAASVAAGIPAEEQAGNALLQALFRLLQSPSLKLRFEGVELVTIASYNADLIHRIANTLINKLEEPPQPFLAEDDDESSTSPHQRQQASCARVLGRIMCEEDVQEVRKPNPDPQLRPEIACFIDQRAVGLTLLRLLRQSAVKDIDTQRECAVALQQIIRFEYRFPEMVAQIKQQTGSELFQLMSTCPDLDLDDIRRLRHHLEEQALPSPPAATTEEYVETEAAPAMDSMTGEAGVVAA